MIFSAGSSLILFIVWTKLAESLVYDFTPKTSDFNFFQSNFATLYDPCVFMISLILSGPLLCAFSVGLSEGANDVFTLNTMNSQHSYKHVI